MQALEFLARVVVQAERNLAEAKALPAAPFGTLHKETVVVRDGHMLEDLRQALALFELEYEIDNDDDDCACEDDETELVDRVLIGVNRAVFTEFKSGYIRPFQFGDLTPGREYTLQVMS